MQINTVFAERSLDEVLEHFEKGFEPNDGEKIIQVRHYVDVAQNKVLFLIVTEKNLSV